MRVVLSALTVALGVAAAAACVDVPDGVRAQFAAPSPADRSNFRPGTHGSAPPVEETPRPPETTGATLPATANPDADAVAPVPSTSSSDGGVS
jgi:hypothetical protein